jgi:hypothetical protein
MIRRSTLVVLGVFIVAVAALLILQRVPNSPIKPAQTPTATTMPKLLSGWNEKDIIEVVLTRAVGGKTDLVKNPDGSWINKQAGPVPTGISEQLLSELLATNIMTELPLDTSLKDLFLENPGQTMVLTSQDGRKATIRVGGVTPTQSGYYVKVNDDAPVIVGKTTLEGIFSLFDQALPAPTPQGSTTPGATQTP